MKGNFKLLWKNSTMLGEFQEFEVRNNELWGKPINSYEMIRVVNQQKQPVLYEDIWKIGIFILILSCCIYSGSTFSRTILMGRLILSSILNNQNKLNAMVEMGKYFNNQTKSKI